MAHATKKKLLEIEPALSPDASDEEPSAPPDTRPQSDRDAPPVDQSGSASAIVQSTTGAEGGR